MSLKQKGKADIVDVARRAGVSISTVSRSFNHPNLVNLATRKKIEKSVKALGTSAIVRRRRCMGGAVARLA
jgi:LacI family transcriptional regulator